MFVSLQHPKINSLLFILFWLLILSQEELLLFGLLSDLCGFKNVEQVLFILILLDSWAPTIVFLVLKLFLAAVVAL